MQRLAICMICLALGWAPGAFADQEAEFEAAGKRKFRKEQKPPISLGTSGGNVTDIDATSCSSGTLGGLIEKQTDDGTVQYVVSNNHVLAKLNEADAGDPVSQPGLIDQKPTCADKAENYVAELSGWRKIKLGGKKKNRVDMALAEVLPGMVNSNGRMIKIGVPGSFFISPTLGLEVKKSGRTTGFTRGTIVAVQVDAQVSYDAANGEVVTARFVDQFVVEGAAGGKFVDSGDSGSFVVKDTKRCPAVVGLVFAANDAGLALVNRIDEVLKAARKVKPRGEARLVGCTPGVAPVAEAAVALRDLRQPRELRSVQRAQRRWREPLLALPEVTAIGVGRSATDPDRPVLKVFVAWDDQRVRERIPVRLEGAPVELVRAGPWIAD